MPDFAPLRLGAFALFFSSACAQAPVAEIDLASERVETARTAEASVFAAEPFERAETALATAQLMTSEQRYLESVRFAGEAVAHADDAFDAATMAKRVAERDVSRCLSELEGLIAIAESRGAAATELAGFRERYLGVKAVADSGDVLGALDQGSQLKPELLAFEQGFRN